MADPKAIAALYNYDPQPIPLADADVKRYVQNELQEIGARLNVLCETFMPNSTVGLTNIDAPFTIPAFPLWEPLDDYSIGVGSENLSYTGMEFDAATGIISFTGSSTELITIEVTASFALTRGTLGFNENVLLRLNDLTEGTDFTFAAAYIVTNQQATFSLIGSIVIEVFGDAALQLQISADAGGTVDKAVGTFAIRPITNKYLIRPNG